MQGLWPGRRWAGKDGIRTALRECGRVQVDPLDVVGRNHDLTFASRVADYRREDLDALLYSDRSAYEHGGTMCIFPRERLPLHWSELQHYGLPPRWRAWLRRNQRITNQVLEEIHSRGPLEARNFLDGEPTENYRSRRREGVALHYLWRAMEILIHHRDGNRKFYDLRERLFEPLGGPFSLEETRTRAAIELTRLLGLSGRLWLSYLPGAPGASRRSPEALRSFRRKLVDMGRLATVELESEREPGVLRAEDRGLLEQVAQGEVPKAWRPSSSEPEAVFLAPLDIVSARARAQSLFGFDYVWEVYKPEHQRTWGYYVLPVLIGDRLVGRIEPRKDAPHRTLRIDRAWWEAGVRPQTLVAPLARGLLRAARGLEMEKVTLADVGPVAFRAALESELDRGAL